MSPPEPVVTLAPVAIFRTPDVCPAPNEMSPVCPTDPIVSEALVKFEAIVIAVVPFVLSIAGDVNLVLTSTVGPLRAIFVYPVVPMVIAIVPVA